MRKCAYAKGWVKACDAQFPFINTKSTRKRAHVDPPHTPPSQHTHSAVEGQCTVRPGCGAEPLITVNHGHNETKMRRGKKELSGVR